MSTFSVVISTYEKNEKQDHHISSETLISNLKSDKDAMNFINHLDFNKYETKDKTNLYYTEIEIEEHDENDNIIHTVTID